MKKLTKLMLTVIAGSTFLLSGVQIASAAPGQGAPARQVQSDRKTDRIHQGRAEVERPRKLQNSRQDNKGRQQARPGQTADRPNNTRPGQTADRPHNTRPGQAVNRPRPQSQGLDRHRAWQMAREHKLTGYKAVPKSYRQKMVKGRPLPAKIKHRPVPGPMRHRLPAYRGYEWHMVGRDLVLVAVGTLVIYEIFLNVFD